MEKLFIALIVLILAVLVGGILNDHYSHERALDYYNTHLEGDIFSK